MRKKDYVLGALAGIAIFSAGFWAGGKGPALLEAGQAIAAVGPAAAGSAAVTSTGVTKTVLFEADHSWDGTPYGAYPAGNADIKIVKIVIPPNSRLGSHTHPMPNIAYVHAGALTVKSEVNGLERQLKQGDFLAEMVNKPHYGYTGDEGVELFLVYCGVSGQELSNSTANTQ